MFAEIGIDNLGFGDSVVTYRVCGRSHKGGDIVDNETDGLGTDIAGHTADPVIDVAGMNLVVHMIDCNLCMAGLSLVIDTESAHIDIGDIVDVDILVHTEKRRGTALHAGPCLQTSPRGQIFWLRSTRSSTASYRPLKIYNRC